ncbi:hypothetical protein F5879DRAFT_995533 [Lentinula edodes]|nr:hypothetical protein F5879DRAFT_995533 [Lentinula edodes]
MELAVRRVWRECDAALYARTSSTSTLLELNILDERDTVDADQQELQKFLALQQSEAALAARHKHDCSPMPVDGPSSKKIRRAVFVNQMIKEYLDEGYYEVALSPLSQLKGDFNKAREDLHRLATFGHCLYRSDPATVFHHHHRYIGAIIEAVVAFLCHGLNSDDFDIVVHNFRLALDYMQAARGVHGDLYMQSISSIQWFSNNTVDKDEGLYCMVLEHSRFDTNGPFLTAAQHAVLSTALPHSDGAGRWDNIVPALPSINQLTADWEQLMLQYIHHITDTPLSGPDTPALMSLVEPVTEPLGEIIVEQCREESPTSPSPPLSLPTLAPLFGSIANLAIDLTDDNDELYEMEESHVGRVYVTMEVVDLAAGQGIIKEELL